MPRTQAAIQRFLRARSYVVAAILAAFGLGFLTAYVVLNTTSRGDTAIREYDARYTFIRPLLICQINEEEESSEFTSLEFKIVQIIAAAKKAGTISSASVYFRDLLTGRWVGVNEDELYSPASLLKVPIMMAYFKDAEDRPEVLAASYNYVQRPDDEPPFKTPLLQSGTRYTVSELIRGMIVQSDNTAKDILQEHANTVLLDETYSALGIKDPYADSGELYKLTAKQYALFFRVLYNGTFLNREMSNEALKLLSEAEFDRGLRAGTPSHIPVARKYGVHADTTNGTPIVELSDCGVIYRPSSPYLLCIMTNGSQPHELATVIEDIAQTVYRTPVPNRE